MPSRQHLGFVAGYPALASMLLAGREMSRKSVGSVSHIVCGAQLAEHLADSQ